MKNTDKIEIFGASENNLNEIKLGVPKNKFVVITGVSGSGKSSLAFDTLYAEGHRRYMENLSSHAHFFLNAVKKPKVKSIENLPPAIAISQKSGINNPRSTVGTITGIYDLLRSFFSLVGKPFCENCDLPMEKSSVDAMVDRIKKLEDDTYVIILAKWNKDQKNIEDKIRAIENLGYSKIRIGKERISTIADIKNNMEDLDAESEIEVVVDRVTISREQFDRERILDSLQTAVKVSGGTAVILIDNEEEWVFSDEYICPKCLNRAGDFSASNFSFNSPEGACVKCGGLGEVMMADEDKIIPNKRLSLAEGAIAPWTKMGGRIDGESFHQQILEGLAKKYKFSLKVPVSKLKKDILEILYFGTSEEFEIKTKNGKREIVFEGLLKNIENKYKKTESLFSKSELEKYMSVKLCPDCKGNRLKPQYLLVKVFDKNISEYVNLEISELINFFREQEQSLVKKKSENVGEKASVLLLEEIIHRLLPLQEVGVDYLTIDRSCRTLSGGELQRIRIASQLYSGLSGILYVLDEPSIGLHSRDTIKLIHTLNKLRDKGNSIIVVEHDRDIMKAADYIIDFGPGAGEKGGEVIFEGTLDRLRKSKSDTALYLQNKKKYQPFKNKTDKNKMIKVVGASQNNLKNIDVEIPLNCMVAVAGVSGGGKSSLVNDIISKGIRKKFLKTKEEPGAHKKIEGLNNLSKIVVVDQAPIGKSPRSNPATYTGVFGQIRELFAKTEEAQKRGYKASHFSFNMRGGRCEYCQGEGVVKIEMRLLDDVFSVCPHCQGKRYNKKVLEIEYHGANIADVLDMNIGYAYHFFHANDTIKEKLKCLCDVGLDYLKLGQNAMNLSGGEAQRVKLATELSRKSKGNCLYVLDEPTIGLHFSDIEKLLKLLSGLVKAGNSVLLVEHNLDIIKVADWVIELGPQGGSKGGEVVFKGTPAELKNKETPTGELLK